MGVIVRQKRKGKGEPWWVFVSHNGKRTSRQVGDKKAAEKVGSDIRAQLQLGEFGFEQKKKRAVPTFKLYAESVFMTEFAMHNHKESTRDSYDSVLKNHVYDAIGDKPLDEITKQDIKDLLVKKRNEGYSPSTVKLIKAYMASIFEYAVGDDEIIPMNPVKSLGKRMQETIRKRDDTEEINPLTREELGLLLQGVQTHFNDHYPLVLTLARTGMRVGEALGLQWGDIDFNSRFIEVRRQYSKGKVSNPKNNKTRRVDMSAQLCKTLEKHKVESMKRGFALGFGGPPEYVFSNQTGNPIDLDGWRRRIFNKTLEKAKLRRIRVHDLRHTYATIRISEGHDIIDVSHQLGHHSEAFTLKVYHHWKPGKRKSEVDALDDKELQRPNAPLLHPGYQDKEKRVAESQLTP